MIPMIITTVATPRTATSFSDSLFFARFARFARALLGRESDPLRRALSEAVCDDGGRDEGRDEIRESPEEGGDEIRGSPEEGGIERVVGGSCSVVARLGFRLMRTIAALASA